MADNLNGLVVEHVRHLPRALRGIALDGVRERVHARRCGKPNRHGCHHVRVDHCYVGDVVRVDADELALLLRVGNHVVDSNLSSGASRGRNRNGEDGVLLRVRNALKTLDVRKLGVVGDDTDGFRRVHRGAAADGHDRTRAALLECLHAILHVLYRGVWLDLVVEVPLDASLVQQVRHLGGHAKLHEVGVGAHENVIVATPLKLTRNLLDGPRPVIRDAIENEPVCHVSSSDVESCSRHALFA